MGCAGGQGLGGNTHRAVGCSRSGSMPRSLRKEGRLPSLHLFRSALLPQSGSGRHLQQCRPHHSCEGWCLAKCLSTWWIGIDVSNCAGLAWLQGLASLAFGHPDGRSKSFMMALGHSSFLHWRVWSRAKLHRSAKRSMKVMMSAFLLMDKRSVQKEEAQYSQSE